MNAVEIVQQLKQGQKVTIRATDAMEFLRQCEFHGETRIEIHMDIEWPKCVLSAPEFSGRMDGEDVTRCAHCGSTEIEDISGEYETGVVAPDGYRERCYENGFRCQKCGRDQGYE